jgi:hypothetical protein
MCGTTNLLNLLLNWQRVRRPAVDARNLSISAEI